MADIVAVMREGELQQLATPAELYARPANLFVARFCGSPPMNVIEGNAADGGFTHPAGSIALAGERSRGAVKLGFRPEHAEVVEPGTPGSLAAEVYVVEPLGNETLVTFRVGEDLVNLRLPASYRGRTGERVAIRPAAEDVHLFDVQTGDAIAGADNATRGE
jgi:multiple sugar transport system ATP-binding protein